MLSEVSEWSRPDEPQENGSPSLDTRSCLRGDLLVTVALSGAVRRAPNDSVRHEKSPTRSESELSRMRTATCLRSRPGAAVGNCLVIDRSLTKNSPRRCMSWVSGCYRFAHGEEQQEVEEAGPRAQPLCDRPGQAEGSDSWAAPRPSPSAQERNEPPEGRPQGSAEVALPRATLTRCDTRGCRRTAPPQPPIPDVVRRKP